MGCPGHCVHALSTLAFTLSVCLMRYALSLCQESATGACLIPVARLHHYVSNVHPLGGFFTAYNQTALVDICRLVGEYHKCAPLITKGCDSIATQNINLLHGAFLPICGAYKQVAPVEMAVLSESADGVLQFSATWSYFRTQFMNFDYLAHRNCYNRQMLLYKSCHQRRQNRINQIQRKDHYHLQICEVTNEYVKCVYLVTALQCSMEAANSYFHILNQSISLSFSDADFSCHIRHPDDDISVLTTTKVTSTVGTPLGYTTSVGGTKGKRSVSAATGGRSANSGCFCVLLILHCIVYAIIL